MSHILSFAFPDKTLVDLLEHEGHLQYWDNASQEWVSDWDLVESHSRARPVCACGWFGRPLPLPALSSGRPDPEDIETMMDGWVGHVQAIRNELLDDFVPLPAYTECVDCRRGRHFACNFRVATFEYRSRCCCGARTWGRR